MNEQQAYPRHGGDAVTPNPSFPRIEDGILAFWKRDDTFRASVGQRAGADEWVFYDGPPFANGLPHYGHLLTGYAKDVFPRFQTMRGKQVPRVFGWDTHGLPAELEAMKQLGITEKAEIEAMGVDVFNAKARESVLRYTNEWQDYVTRQARWVDFDGGYKTLDATYMESVIWAFKTLWDKGLAYEGYRVLPYCWRDETPLSSHELRMDDDVYQDRQDPSVTVSFPLQGHEAAALGLDGVRALAWTTTPWTLPTNLALAVGPAIEYAVVVAGPHGAADGGAAGVARYLLAADTVAAHAAVLGYEDQAPEIDATFRGSELQRLRYAPLFADFTDVDEWGTEQAWQFLADDYVATGEGTGIVHQAPAYGEDDQRVTAAAGIPTILSVDDGGRFLSLFGSGELADIVGVQVFEANRTIIRRLQANGRLLREASYVHSYPHCWRCRNPLIYKAVSSWFVKVTDIKDDLIAANDEIRWVPENVKYGQFGKWLEGARDWSISRNRYWGSPIPVWKSDNPDYPRVDVYGSLDELERDFGVRPDDLHRPFIDELTRPNPDDPTGKSVMRRIPDVLDVWFDSGSMPFAQFHYPFENEAWFAAHSPADYIVEYIGQTRGWFYVMHVLSVALFGRPAFQSVVSHGIVLGSDGYKMSKSLQNYPDVGEVFDRDGSDAMRWFLISSSVLRGGNLVVTEEGIRSGVREFMLPLWSTWYFFATYANRAIDGAAYSAKRRTTSGDVLDRYILAKLGATVRVVGDAFEALDATTATAELRDFVDVLTNWYVRRSRDRFWDGVNADGNGRDAFDTLYTVLETLCRIAAPVAPIVTEEVWRGLTGSRSVHLADWPDATEFPSDDELISQMDEVRAVVGALHAMRKRHKLRVRLPLAEATVTSRLDMAAFADLIADEVNIKRVLVKASSGDLPGLAKTAQIVSKTAAPRLKGDFKRVFDSIRRGEWSLDGERLRVDDVTLEPGEFTLVDQPSESAYPHGDSALLDNTHIDLDVATTPDLAAEGLARDAVRAIQDARKRQALDVSDRIVLVLGSDAHGELALATHRELVMNETLATNLTIERVDDTAGEGADAVDGRVGDGSPLTIRLERA